MSETAILLGSRIRDLRRQRKMSQEELAFKSSISAAHLGQIERAVKNPTIDTVARIAEALEVSMPELFAIEQKSSTPERSVTVNKILAYLSSMPESQQNDILKIIRIYKKSR